MATAKRGPGRPVVEALTGSQQRTLEEIRQIVARKHLPPTMQELATAMGMTAASAHEQVNQLVRKGYLKREPRKARNLVILKGPPDEIGEFIEIPIVGTVAAGYPILAEENIVGHVIIDGNVARRGRCFALNVVGDSMIRAGIKAGDLVIVRQQAMAENGDIVVAMLDGDATVKRLSICEEVVQLCPENPKYQPIVIEPDQDFRILGKVMGVRRLDARRTKATSENPTDDTHATEKVPTEKTPTEKGDTVKNAPLKKTTETVAAESQAAQTVAKKTKVSQAKASASTPETSKTASPRTSKAQR